MPRKERSGGVGLTARIPGPAPSCFLGGQSVAALSPARRPKTEPAISPEPPG